MPFSIDALISLDCKCTEEILRSKSPPKEFRDERKLAAYLSAFGRPDSPDEPAGFTLLDGVPLLTLLKQLSGLPRDGKVSVLNVDVDFVLGETRQFERRSHQVLVGIFIQVHPIPQESATERSYGECG